MDMDKKIKRLENLLEFISSCEKYQSEFNNLYKINDEYSLESEKEGSISYRNNLKQTINKQAKSFKLAAQKWNSPNKLNGPYSDFIDNFRRDVQGELSMLNLKKINSV